MRCHTEKDHFLLIELFSTSSLLYLVYFLLISLVFTMAANHVVLPIGQGAPAANPVVVAGGIPTYLEPLPLRQEVIDRFSADDEATRRAYLSGKWKDKIKDRIYARTRREVFTNPRFNFIRFALRAPAPRWCHAVE